MTSEQPTINETEEPEADAGLPSKPGGRAVAALEDAVAASVQGGLDSKVSPADETTFSEAELAGLTPQLAERGIDLGSLLGTMLAGAGQAKAKPKPRPSAADAKDDPAVLLRKLAESLGLSPEALAKQLGPILKKMLAGPAATSGSKPRRKPKPKPAGKPKEDSAKPSAKPKPKPASKPKKEGAKPAAKPKPKTTR